MKIDLSGVIWDLNKAGAGRRGGGGGDRPPIDWVKIAESVARDLLGDPNRHLSDKRQLRWGSKGSISLDLRTGGWFDHERGEGGGVLALVERELCCDRAGAMEWLRQQGYVEGLDPSRTITHDDRQRWDAARAKRDRQQAERAAIADEETAWKSALAARQWHEAGPVVGTPAVTYLRDVRKIERGPEGAARYTPAFEASLWDRNPRPAVLFPITNDAGEVVAVQAVRLDPDGGKARNLGDRAKTTLGPVGTGFLRLPGTGPLHVAEGPETGLSVWLATGAPVLVCCGAISANRVEALPVKPGDTVVIAGDASAPGSAVEATLTKAISAGVARGLNMRLAVPAGGAGTDWNDVLQAQGVEAVRAGLSAVVADLPAGWGPATMRAPTGTVEDARRDVGEAFQRWIADALSLAPDPEMAGHAPVRVLRVGTGIGKSHAARLAVVDLVRTLRSKGDTRPVVIAVPRHNLGDEYRAALAEIGKGVRVAAYRGRDQVDPNAEGELMCRRSEDAREADWAGVDVERTLCKAGKDRCSFFETCGYQRQKQTRADIWIVPHELLWRKPPKQIGSPAALVVDEDAVAGALGGFDPLRPTRVSLDDLKQPLQVQGRDAAKAAEATADLTALSSRLSDALRGMIEDGGCVDPGKLREAGLTAADMAEGRKLAWAAKRQPDAGPTTPSAALRAELVKVGSHNGQAMKRARLFGILADALDDEEAEIVPGLRVGMVTTANGDSFDAVAMRWRKDVADGWNVPTVLASATAQEAMQRTVWSEVVEVVEAYAGMPHVMVRQVTDTAFSAQSVCPPEYAAAETQRHAASTRGKLRRYIETRHAALGSRTLVVGQKALIEALAAEGLPEGVETAHYNALSGIDRWRDVRTLICIGRTLPPTSIVEDMAEVLAGRRIHLTVARYPFTPAFIDMQGSGAGPLLCRRSGKGAVPMPGVERHPDELAEAIRWSICEGEVMQAIGRGRGVNREVDNPLQIDILTAYPLLIAVDEAGPFEGFEPTPGDLMAARGIVVEDTSQKGAWPLVAAILSDLFETAEAARDAGKERAHSSHGGNPYIVLNGISPREGATARIRLPEARYAVSVRIRAVTEAEAQELIDRLLPNAVLTAFEPPAQAQPYNNACVRQAGTPAPNTPDARETPAAQPPPELPGDEAVWDWAMALARKLQNERARNAAFIGAMRRLADAIKDVPPEDIAWVRDGDVVRLCVPDTPPPGPPSPEEIEASPRRPLRKARALRSPRCQQLKAERDAERNRLAAE